MITAAERVKAQFEDLWGQCTAAGSADKLGPFLDEQAILIGDGQERILHGRQAVCHYLTELITELGFLDVVRMTYQAQGVSPEGVLIYGVIDVGEASVQFSLFCQVEAERFVIKHFHVSYSQRQWVDEAADQEEVCQSLKELSQSRRQELDRRLQELRDSEAIYRFVLEATSDLIFDIDVVNKDIHIDQEKMMRLFEVELSSEPSITEIYNKMVSAIWPADREGFVEKFDIQGDTLQVMLQVDLLEQEFRIINQEHGYLWLRITMIPIRRGNNAVRRLVANIKNIDQEKRMELEIKRRSERDPLTDLGNRGYTESGVNEYLQKHRGQGALLMIDVDNFKLVNDNLGHQAGDQVLRDLGQLLQAAFRSSDIVGRIGGDEFVAFMKDITDRHLAEKKAQAINEAFRKSFAGMDCVFAISASVGIAMVREEDSRFDELLHRADLALYHRKQHGKNGYAFYEDWAKEQKKESEVDRSC